MVQSYSVFCSHHNESINIYKEQLQNNKKMQILMRVRELHLTTILCGLGLCFQELKSYEVSE